MFYRPFTVAIVSLSMFHCFAARADDASCKPLLDAFARQLDTPFRESITGHGRTTEKIVLLDATFIKMQNGGWVRNPITAQERNEQLAAARATTSNCQLVGQETVDDQAATYLMIDFYDQLWAADPSRKLSKLESLRYAQLRLLRGESLPDKVRESLGAKGPIPPSIWGPFVISGSLN